MAITGLRRLAMASIALTGNLAPTESCAKWLFRLNDKFVYIGNYGGVPSRYTFMPVLSDTYKLPL